MTPQTSPARLRRFAALSFAIALTVVFHPLAAADSGKSTYALPAGDAEETLRLFIRQSGAQLLYPPNEVSGITTNAVNGEFTPYQALDTMLAGTELHAAEDTRTGALTVRRRAHPPARTTADGASDGPEEPVALNPFEVTAGSDRGYGALYNVAGSRINTASMDEPMAVISVTQALMRDLAPDEPSDALQYISGVNSAGTYNGANSVTIRGFQINTFDWRDGLPDQSGDSGADYQDEYLTDRIEVVKGPAGVEYGATTLGGILDIITKKPLPYNQAIFTASVESFDTQRGIVDVNQVAGPNNQWQGRLIVDVQNGKTFYGGVNDMVDVNPTLYYHLDKDTYFWVRFDFNKTRVAAYLSSWLVDAGGNISTFLPYNRPLENINGEAETDYRYKYEIGEATAFSALGTTWNMRLVGRENHLDIDQHTNNLSGIQFINAAGAVIATGTQPAGLFSNPAVADIQLTRLIRDAIDYEDNANLNLDVTALYDWGAIRDQISSYSYMAFQTERSYRYQFFLPNQDIFHPVQWPDEWVYATYDNLAINSEVHNNYFAWGAQDNLQLFNDRLVLVGGARWDWGWTHSDNYLVTTNAASTGGSDSDWTFKYGAIYKILTGFGVYYQHAETFTPQVGFLNNNPATPERNLTGVADEVGAKAELFDGRLTGTVSAFNMTLDNNLYVPPAINGVVQPTIQDGVNRTRGWEGDVAYEPVESVALMLAYTNLTSKDENGIWQRAVSQGASYKALVKYTFLNGPLKNLGLGYGYVYDGPRAGATGDTFTLPAYGVSNGFIFYSQRHWRAQLNASNLFNKVYAMAASNNQEIYTGPGLTLKFSVTYFLK